ncbi:MAG: hypothetical protein JO002_02695, partial [Burkholderiaceae bacterium]|nr:hypothetical protein [Burkholderiaceae bacterium]
MQGKHKRDVDPALQQAGAGQHGSTALMSPFALHGKPRRASFPRCVLVEALSLSTCALVLSACGANTADTSTAAPPASTKRQVAQKSAAGYQTAVEALYIAYFGRPADPTGLANFEA